MPTDDQLKALAWAVVNRIKPKAQDRDDLFQTAYITGLESARGVEARGGTISHRYLYRTMFRRAMTDHIGDKKHLSTDMEPEASDGAAGIEDVDEADWNSTKGGWLRANLHRLTEKERDAVYLVSICGLSLTEVAGGQGISKRGLCERIRRATLKLKRFAEGEE